MGDLHWLESELTAACGTPSATTRERAERLRGTPLLHCARRPRDLVYVIGAACLLSRRQRCVDPPQSPSDMELELDDHVYASVGYFYPAEVGLVFRASIEDTTVEATPWDTGTFVKRMTNGWSTNERRRIHGLYTLRSPDYRSYLVASAAVLFADPVHYLTGGPLLQQVPAALVRRGRMAQAFEARFVARMSAAAEHLQAVFLDQTTFRHLPKVVLRWLADLQLAGVTVKPLVTSREPLAIQVERYLVRELGLAS